MWTTRNFVVWMYLAYRTHPLTTRAACMPNLRSNLYDIRRASMRLVYLGEEIILCYQTIRTEGYDD